MLRRIKVKNFIHFEEEEDLVVQEGPYFCVGPNGAGKSAFFEAIRRCMSTSMNMGLSSRHDPTKPSIAMCVFLVDTPAEVGREIREIISCIVRRSVDRQEMASKSYRGTETAIKCVFDKARDVVHADILRFDRGVFVNDPVQLEDPNTELKRLFSDDTLPLDSIMEELIRVADHGVLVDDDVLTYKAKTACERFLKDNVDSKVVIIYPIRSSASVQWTLSEKLAPNKMVDTEQEVQERAEILKWYFDPKNNALICKDQIQRYFDIITDNCTVKFHREEDGRIVAYEREGSAHLLGIDKVPEGYNEAMVCAIVLAHPDFKTVCLEEPGRSMHPQMVERLRDLVLKPIRNKTVMVTSHKPAFITAWNIPRMFFFKKIRTTNDVVRHKIIPGKGLVDKAVGREESNPADTDPGQEYEKTRRITTTRHFSTLYFARRVLLVEGDSDLLFFNELKSILLMDATKSLLTDVFRVVTSEGDTNTDNLIDEFQRFLWPLHILGLNGETNKRKMETICKQLEIERYFVLDYDAITDKLVDESSGKPLPERYKQFRNTFDLTYTNMAAESKTIGEEDIRQDVRVLENVGIFVWKELSDIGKGAIETALKELHINDRSSSLKDTLTSNRVELQWDTGKKEKHRHKLFVHKHLTDENIHNVVVAVLEQCQRKTLSQFFRFLTFLFTICLKQRRKCERPDTTIYTRSSNTAEGASVA